MSIGKGLKPESPDTQAAQKIDEETHMQQRRRESMIEAQYDFIICGAGSSGSVVARRLAENPAVNVLLLEAGGSDDVPSVMDPLQWPKNLGSERDWGFASEPEPHLNGRSIPLSMGKVLGGGSSINVLVWARGHRSDWDYFAAEAGDTAWNYDAVLQIYKGIEDWQGVPDSLRRGSGGPVFLQQPPTPHPLTIATLEACESVGVPVFQSPNGIMMEGEGGASRYELILKDGKRHSVFRAYTYPVSSQPNLTVMMHTRVSRLTLSGSRVTGVEILRGGKLTRVGASCEVVLSLGAIETPRVLMQSGIGDQNHLASVGVPVVQHLPGVGKNLQDHINFGCIWEYREPLEPLDSGAEATIYWKSEAALEGPDLLLGQAEFPVPSPQTKDMNVPKHGWTMFAGVCRPHSRGNVSLTGPNVDDPLQIQTNALSHPADVRAAFAAVALSREIGNAPPLRSINKREALPGNLRGPDLLNFLRNAGVTYWHETCTAKMGRDAMSVVDGHLAVYGIQNLRIADGSILPRVTTGNTMAPCVVIGERAAAILRQAHTT